MGGSGLTLFVHYLHVCKIVMPNLPFFYSSAVEFSKLSDYKNSTQLVRDS